MEATLPEICGITALPAVAMALGSMAVSAGQPSEKLEARLQHLSAGLLLGAVTTEIFPILRSQMVPDSSRVDWSHVVTAMLGFAAALTVMYSLKSLGLEDDEESEAEQSSAAVPGKGTASVVSTLKEPLLAVSSDEEHPQSPTHSGWVLAKQPSEEEYSRLTSAVSRLQAKCSTLRSLVDADEVDREAVDEEVHGLDFLVDSARRVCRGAEPIEPRNANRLRHHVSQLVAGIERLKQMDLKEPATVDAQLKETAACVRHIHSHAERATFRRWRPPQREVVPLPTVEEGEASRDSLPSPTVPVGMILAVIVDSSVDGMLIGLAGSVARGSGCLLALATAIEMGFLGYSFACSLTKALRRPWVAVVILAMPPVTMLFASVLAFEGAYQAKSTPAFCGLIAFALAAVLFLVLDELLLEAHEKEESEGWTVSVWLYIGLLLSIGFDVLF
ncbi:unnamed protein product [Durusdinium trenchii]|uniref:Uncharacterized protein n=1 Tax=Durusdinium trenchii TaxID=1381693 RepID=A0ABP0QKS3_9DINO